MTPVHVGDGITAYLTTNDYGSTGYAALDHRLCSVTLTIGDDVEEESALREMVTLLGTGSS